MRALAAFFLAICAFIYTGDVQANMREVQAEHVTHHGPGEAQQTMLPGQTVHFGYFEEIRRPDYATNCRSTIRSSRTSAVGVCYNWSGSGNYKFQEAGLMFDGCNRYYWAYGNVGYPYIPGKTSTGKWSYVYTPPGFWRIVAAKVVIWKP